MESIPLTSGCQVGVELDTLYSKLPWIPFHGSTYAYGTPTIKQVSTHWEIHNERGSDMYRTSFVSKEDAEEFLKGTWKPT